MQRFLSTMATLAFVLVAGSSMLFTDFGVSRANAQTADAETTGIVEMTLGAEDAPVTVIEYASFTCPHCANFHENTFGELKKNYIDTGKVKFVYREVYFDRFGLWAGMVARCGGEQRYFALVDMLYDGQKEWLAGGEPAQIAENLRRIGRTAGMDDEQLNVCLNDSENAKALVAAYQENAERDGINSTPSFIIDGEKNPNMNYADFSALLDKKLAE